MQATCIKGTRRRVQRAPDSSDDEAGGVKVVPASSGLVTYEELEIDC